MWVALQSCCHGNKASAWKKLHWFLQIPLENCSKLHEGGGLSERMMSYWTCDCSFGFGHPNAVISNFYSYVTMTIPSSKKEKKKCKLYLFICFRSRFCKCLKIFLCYVLISWPFLYADMEKFMLVWSILPLKISVKSNVNTIKLFSRHKH